MTTPPQRVDGRTARSERTRNAIVDAHVSLITDGDLRPTADRIAKLAGVSLRALWSHFADMEALFAASGQRILDRRDASYEPIPPDLPLAERINAYCRQRARLSELIAPGGQGGRAEGAVLPGAAALPQTARGTRPRRAEDPLRRRAQGRPGTLGRLDGGEHVEHLGHDAHPDGADPEAARAVLTRTITALLATN